MRAALQVFAAFRLLCAHARGSLERFLSLKMPSLSKRHSERL